MPEGGLSPTEVGNEIAGRAEHAHDHGEEHHDWVIAVVEAVLLALVAVLAAWSGYSSAKWSTESRLRLAQASTARTEASNNELASMTQRNFDSSTFEAWFTAYVAGNAQAEEVAERRFTPNFHEPSTPGWPPTLLPTQTFHPDLHTCPSTSNRVRRWRQRRTTRPIFSTTRDRQMATTRMTMCGRLCTWPQCCS